MKQFNRRDFLKASLLTTASLSVAPVWAASTGVAGANEKIRFAVVGFGGRGKDHIGGMREVAGTQLAALCDADSKILEREVKNCENRGEKVQGYTDIRKLLENKEVDVITIATPNHWHSLAAIWAVQAGKDVYVEKPVSHNVWEGRKLVEASRKYNRIVQAGTQCRSSEGIQEAIQWVREGHIGKILRSRGLCYKRRASIGKVDGPQPVPPEIDYDLWCGPAPKEPLMRKRLHYD
ncbi:MAG TPA: Gfo/Idh/MocA family oxidoreductase, partial [Verrucomicrobiae bacterium]